jgi:hypothetical protein
VCQVLEERLDRKREAVLEKELVLEEVTALSEKLRSQAVAKRDAAKALADELNDLQVHDYPTIPYPTLPYPTLPFLPCYAVTLTCCCLCACVGFFAGQDSRRDEEDAR